MVLMPDCSASPNGFADRLGQGTVQPSSSAAFKAGFTQDPAVLAASYEQVGATQVVLFWQRGHVKCACACCTSLAVPAVWHEQEEVCTWPHVGAHAVTSLQA